MANANCSLCNTFHPYTGHSPITAGDLTSFHLGVQVCITDDLGHGFQTGVSGTLSSVEHGANLIAETSLGSGVTDWVLGRRWVQVGLLNYGGARVSPGATVELLV